jgi:hypothetical protein
MVAEHTCNFRNLHKHTHSFLTVLTSKVSQYTLKPVLKSGRESGDMLSALRISLAEFPFAASSNMAIFVERPNGEKTRFSRPGAKAYGNKNWRRKLSTGKVLSQKQFIR